MEKFKSRFWDWLFSSTNNKEKKVKPKQLWKNNKYSYNDISIMTEREIRLRYGSIWKTILYFCIPTVILMFTQGLYNVLDKTLSLQFATPHAINNIKYFYSIIVGTGKNDFSDSLLYNALINKQNNISDLDVFKIFFNTKNLSSDLEEKIKVYLNSKEMFKLYDLIIQNKSSFSIQESLMKKYINVTTQYTMQTYNLAYSFSQILAIGTGMHFAIEFGKRERKKLGEISGNAISYSFLSSIFIAFILFSISYRPWGQIFISVQMGGQKNLVIEELAWTDVMPLIYGLPFMFVSGVTMNVIRSEGKMYHILTMTLTSLVIKFTSSILFMQYAGLELTGAQLGTIAAFAYQLIYSLFVIFFSKISYSKFVVTNLFIINFKNFAYAIKSGIPNFVIYFAVVVNSYIVTSLVIKLPIPNDGPSFNENGGVSILQQLISSMTPWAEFILSACIGLNQGVRTIIAYNYGAGKNKRILDVLKKSTWLMFGWFTFILLMIIFAGPYMMTMFAFPKEYAKYGNIFYWYQLLYFITYPFASATYVALGLFQGTNRNKIATITSSFRSMTIFIPLVFIGFGFSTLSNNPIWFFLFIGITDLISALIIIPILYIYFVRSKQKGVIKNSDDDMLTKLSYYKTMFEKTNEQEWKNKFYKLNN